MPEPTISVVVPTLIEIFRGIFGRDRGGVGPFNLPPGITSTTPAPRSRAELEEFEERNLATARSAGLAAFPATVPAPGPVPAPPATRTPPYFPTGPAANDPIFRQAARGALPRILGPGSLVITAVQVAIEVLRRQQDREAQEIIDRQDDDIAAATRRRMRDAELREVEIRGLDIPGSRLPPPDLPDRPQALPLPPARQPFSLPDLLPFPDIAFPVPAPGAPAQPQPLPIPEPLAVPDPRPAPTSPGSVPGPVSPAPGPLPFEFPLFTPFGLPGFGAAPGTPGLTQPNPVSVPSGEPLSVMGFADLPEPLPIPRQDTAQDRCKPRRCDDDLEEDRLECYKGLYREGPRETEFTQWVEIDCITGAEL